MKKQNELMKRLEYDYKWEINNTKNRVKHLKELKPLTKRLLKAINGINEDYVKRLWLKCYLNNSIRIYILPCEPNPDCKPVLNQKTYTQQTWLCSNH